LTLVDPELNRALTGYPAVIALERNLYEAVQARYNGWLTDPEVGLSAAVERLLAADGLHPVKPGVSPKLGLEPGCVAREISAAQWFNSPGLSLQELSRRSQVAVLVFFDSRWLDARALVKTLNELQDRFAKRGVVVVGLTAEAPENIQDFLAKNKVTWAVGAGSETAQIYGVSSEEGAPLGRNRLPSAFLVDRHRYIAWAFLRRELSYVGTAPGGAAALLGPAVPIARVTDEGLVVAGPGVESVRFWEDVPPAVALPFFQEAAGATNGPGALALAICGFHRRMPGEPQRHLESARNYDLGLADRIAEVREVLRVVGRIRDGTAPASPSVPAPDVNPFATGRTSPPGP